MDRREGFHAAVIKLRSPEWSPAFPDMNTLNVGGEYWTIRQVCDLVKDDDGVLPDEIVDELKDAMHGVRRLLELLGRSRTEISTMGQEIGQSSRHQPTVVFDGTLFHMVFSANDDTNRILYVTSRLASKWHHLCCYGLIRCGFQVYPPVRTLFALSYVWPFDRVLDGKALERYMFLTADLRRAFSCLSASLISASRL